MRLNRLIESRLRNILEVSKDTVEIIEKLKKEDNNEYNEKFQKFCLQIYNILEKELKKFE